MNLRVLILPLVALSFIASVFYAAKRLMSDPDPARSIPSISKSPVGVPVSSFAVHGVPPDRGARSTSSWISAEELKVSQVKREEFVEQDAGGLYLVKAPALSKTIKSTVELGQLLGWGSWCARQEFDPSSPTVPVCSYMIQKLPEWLDMMDARAKRTDAADAVDAIQAQTWLDKVNNTLKNPPPRAADDAMVEGALALWWAQLANR